MTMMSIDHAVNEARTSWLCNSTRGDHGWKVKQLHGLHRLLIANRDEIVSTIARDYSISATLVERQLSLVVGDITAHIVNIASRTLPQERDTVRGRGSLEYQPCGVSLILSGSSEPLCDAIAPLASSIAAGNITILGIVRTQSNSLFSILQRELSTYMDAFSIYVLSDVSFEQLRTGDFDQIVVFDDHPDKYEFLLADPKSKFYSTRHGYKFAVVDTGKVDHEKLAQQILQCSAPNELASRGLSAVFVPEEIVEDLYPHISKVAEASSDSQSKKGLESPRASLVVLNKNKSATSLLDELERAQHDGTPIIITCTSLDQALDSIGKLESKVSQIAIISPASKKHAEYVKKWTSASCFTLDQILPLSMDISEWSTSPKGFKPCMYPAAIFSRPQLTISNVKTQPGESISSIRSSYERSFPPYMAEPRGQRVDFFDQVFYIVQGVGAVVGALSVVGLWYGGKATRKYSKG